MYQIILTDGPHVADPTDIAPIYVVGSERGDVRLIPGNWLVRLSLWYMRRFVKNCLNS